MKVDVEIMEILAAYDLTGTLRVTSLDCHGVFGQWALLKWGCY